MFDVFTILLRNGSYASTEGLGLTWIRKVGSCMIAESFELDIASGEGHDSRRQGLRWPQKRVTSWSAIGRAGMCEMNSSKDFGVEVPQSRLDEFHVSFTEVRFSSASNSSSSWFLSRNSLNSWICK